MKVWENSKNTWKHLPAVRNPTDFLVPPKLPLVFPFSTQLDYEFEIYIAR